jgi:hypothetical protein
MGFPSPPDPLSHKGRGGERLTVALPSPLMGEGQGVRVFDMKIAFRIVAADNCCNFLK